MKIHEHELKFNYSAIKEFKKLTGKSLITDSENLELEHNIAELIYCGILGANYPNKTSVTIADCEAWINEDMQLLVKVPLEFAEQVKSTFAAEQKETEKSPN